MPSVRTDTCPVECERAKRRILVDCPGRRSEISASAVFDGCVTTAYRRRNGVFAGVVYSATAATPDDVETKRRKID